MTRSHISTTSKDQPAPCGLFRLVGELLRAKKSWKRVSKKTGYRLTHWRIMPYAVGTGTHQLGDSHERMRILMATSTKTPTPGLNITNKPDLAADLALVAEYKAQERAGKAAERARKVVEARLQAALADAGQTQFVKRGIVVARLSSQRTTGRSCDFDTLLSGFPEAYNATVTPGSHYRFLEVL